MRDEGTRALVKKVLGEPDLYPDEFKSYLPKILAGNALFRLETFQLPQIELKKYVGDTGQPAFLNSWVNFAGGYELAGFYRDTSGRVHLCGLVKSGTSATTIFTLPGGYRPKNTETYGVLTGSPGDTFGRVEVDANGNVKHVSGGTSYVQLSGISFRAF